MPGGRSRYSTTFSFRSETDGLTRGFARARRETRQFTAQISGTFTELTNNARNFALGVTAALAPLTLLGARGLQAANQIETLVRQTDLSARSAAGWVNAFRAFGAEASDVEDVLRTLTTRIIEFRRGEGTALEAFTALGATASDFRGSSSQNLATFLRLLGAATPEARLFALDELVGDSAQFLSQMAESVGEVSRLRRAAERVHQPTERLTTQWRSIRADIALAADTLGTSFVRGLVGTNDLSELTANLAENLPTIAESVERLGNAVRGFAGFLGQIAPLLGILSGGLAGLRLFNAAIRPLVDLLSRFRALQGVQQFLQSNARSILPIGAFGAGATGAGILSTRARNELREAVSGPVEDGVTQGITSGLTRSADLAQEYSFELSGAVLEHRAINQELEETQRLLRGSVNIVSQLLSESPRYFSALADALSTPNRIQEAERALVERLLSSVGLTESRLDSLGLTLTEITNRLLSTINQAGTALVTNIRGQTTSLRASGAEDESIRLLEEYNSALSTSEVVVGGFADAAENATGALVGLRERINEEFFPRGQAFARFGTSAEDRSRFAQATGDPTGRAQRTQRLIDEFNIRAIQDQIRRGEDFLRREDVSRGRPLSSFAQATTGIDARAREAEELGEQLTERLTQSLQFGIRSSVAGFFAGRDAGDLSALGENLLDAITGSIARSFADSITRSLFDPLIEGFVGSIFGSFNEGIANLGGQLANLIGGFFSSLFSGFNLGGFFSGIGGILGFQGGGRVPGPEGAPQLAIVHGGEVILNRRQQAGLDSEGGGTNVTFNIQGDVTRQTRQVILSTIPEIADRVQQDIRRANYQLTGSYA